jgi:hypothetical protein
MGQVLHGSATTTEARRYGINQKTVAKWKWRRSVADLPTGPKDPCSGSRLSRAVSGAVVGRSRRSGRSGDRRREPGIWSSTERDYSEARDHVWPAIRLASAANPACGRTASASGRSLHEWMSLLQSRRLRWNRRRAGRANHKRMCRRSLRLVQKG